jgi:ParB family chromosome partitioning protein
LSTGHARTLIALEDADIQRRLARRIIEQDLSVRATERLVKSRLDDRPRKPARAAAEPADANVRAAETRLRRQFGTQVRIVHTKGSAAGRIELEFYNATDLDRLYTLLMSNPQ